MEKIVCYTDGGSRGNPGASGAGVLIQNESGEVLQEMSQHLGNGTNNFAEYMAVVIALQTLKKRYGKTTKDMLFEVRMDSELVQKQLSHEYQIKEPGLVPLFIEIHNMHISSFPNLIFTHVKREDNERADALANEAMDGGAQQPLL